jgi:glycogen operon protein
MLLMGDEIRRTQNGNNNAYCIDDESTWFDWSAIARHADIHRFVKQLIAFRTTRTLPVDRFAVTLSELIEQHRVEWHGIVLREPDWSDSSHSLAATFHFDADRIVLHLMMNAYWEALSFEIPPLDEMYLPWRRCVDTFRPAPDDILGWPNAEAVNGAAYRVEPRSIVVLVTKLLVQPSEGLSAEAFNSGGA